MLFIFQGADNDLVGLLATQQVLIVCLAAEGELARNTGVTESGDAHKYGLSTDFDKEMGQLDTAKAALRSGFAEIGAKARVWKICCSLAIKEFRGEERVRKRLESAGYSK